MIENITDEKLQEILSEVVIPNSSVGVHGVRGIGHHQQQDNLETYHLIETEGLKLTTPYGIVGNVEFINMAPDYYDVKDITNYFHAINGNNINNVIVAIPEIIELSNGEKVYLGNFLMYEGGYGKNDERVRLVPTNKIDKIPSEFIVGTYIRNINTNKSDFILNKNYIGLKSSLEQKNFYSRFIKQYPHLRFLKFNEQDNEYADRLSDADDFYIQKFLEKYEELVNNKKKKIQNITDEKLQAILNEVVIPNSSVGVHGIDNNQQLKTYYQIETEGLKLTTPNGIVGNVEFINMAPDYYDVKDITNYFHAINDNNINNVIVAIPEIIELSNGEKVYLGNFLMYEGGYGKNDERVWSVPTNKIDKIPSEFIVGTYIRNINTNKSDFILNKNYIGLKSPQKQHKFYNKFIKQYPHLRFLKFNEQDNEYADSLSDALYADDFYTQKFLEKYEELFNKKSK